ncbi:MAG: serine/threonine-protein kinase [Kofleriaceae bacterium]
MIGTIVLERYQVEAELGSGAMGTVYRGKHIKLNRTVAIKVMHDHLGHDRRMVERFLREGRIAARLNHPNVIGVLDVGEEGHRQVMVLELAEGRTLTEVLEIDPAPRRVIRLVQQLLLGLDHAHAAGLIHRDLKPDNVIVQIDREGTEIPRIVDFGIAVLRDPEEAGGKLTETGQVLGTPIYMSPEQAQAEPIDHRTDLFALGVIVYEMLAGKVPFEGSAIDIALANINKDPPPIRGADPLLEAFARKLMARNLSRRFQSAHEALHVLALIETDRRAAGLALGFSDVALALETISLPPVRRR